FLSILVRMKEDRREVLINVGIGTHGKRGRQPPPAFAQLKLMADLRKKQTTPSHLSQENGFEGKIDLGELDDVGFALAHVLRETDPGRNQPDRPLPAPN